MGGGGRCVAGPGRSYNRASTPTTQRTSRNTPHREPTSSNRPPGPTYPPGPTKTATAQATPTLTSLTRTHPPSEPPARKPRNLAEGERRQRISPTKGRANGRRDVTRRTSFSLSRRMLGRDEEWVSEYRDGAMATGKRGCSPEERDEGILGYGLW